MIATQRLTAHMLRDKRSMAGAEQINTACNKVKWEVKQYSECWLKTL